MLFFFKGVYLEKMSKGQGGGVGPAVFFFALFICFYQVGIYFTLSKNADTWDKYFKANIIFKGPRYKNLPCFKAFPNISQFTHQSAQQLPKIEGRGLANWDNAYI